LIKLRVTNILNLRILYYNLYMKNKTITIVLVLCGFFACVITSCAVSFFALYEIGKAEQEKSNQRDQTTTKNTVGDPMIEVDKLSPLSENITDKSKKTLINDFDTKFRISYEINNKSKFDSTVGKDLDYLKANISYFNTNLSRIFGIKVEDKIDLVFTDDLPSFIDFTDRDWDKNTTGAAVTTKSDKIFIYQRLDSYRVDSLVRLLSHEMVHIYQFEITGDSFPLWYLESMADYISIYEFYDYERDELQFPATLNDLEKEFKDTASDQNNSNDTYTKAYFFFEYLTDTYGRDKIINILRDNGSKDFNITFSRITGTTPQDAFGEFLDSIQS